MELLNKAVVKYELHGRVFELHIPVPSTYGEAFDCALAMADYFHQKNKESFEQVKEQGVELAKPIEPEVS